MPQTKLQMSRVHCQGTESDGCLRPRSSGGTPSPPPVIQAIGIISGMGQPESVVRGIAVSIQLADGCGQSDLSTDRPRLGSQNVLVHRGKTAPQGVQFPAAAPSIPRDVEQEDQPLVLP